MKKIYVWLAALTWLLLISFQFFVPVLAQVSQSSVDSESKVRMDKMESYLRENNTTSALSKLLENQQGWAKYIRSSIHDGNLIETSFINQGQLADGWLEGTGGSKMIWPKGSGVEYGWAFIFFVAGEVTDVHGNVIHIVSDRFSRYDAETSEDQSHRYHWMPLPGYFNNHHPDSYDWDFGGISEDMGIDGIPNSNDEGEGDGLLQLAEDVNRNGILDLSLINGVEWSAMSHRRETWPTWWPPQSYPGDDRMEGDERPGVRAGRWNGEFGAYVRASQESYYLMDDHENDEFEYYPFEDSLSMRPWPYGKRGLGVTVEVRQYQWNAPMAEDILIVIYDIINYGKPISKAVVGMYAEPDIGGHAHSDEADFDQLDDITYAWDLTNYSSIGTPTAYFGFAFLESPGLPFNGIDDDEDGMIDESQTNGIDDDGDWRSWEDENGNGVYDNEDVNYNGVLDDGEDANNNGKLDFEPMWDDIGSDGLGPEYDGYTGPDPDGSEANGVPDVGEPNFETMDNDESDQIGLTSWYLRDVDNNMADDENFWNIELQPGRFAIDPEYQRDLGWVYGSGFIELTTGKEGQHRYAIACLFGNDEQDILRNKRTMQNIYDADYNFAQPPRQPVVNVESSDGRVVLTWDRRAESSRDPIYGQDFEGYKIYKSTYPTFADIKTISDAFGNPLYYKPIAQYDEINGLKGPHPVNLGENGGLGVAFNMGTDSGLQHHFIDTDVTNGRTYYYAVTAFDKGYDLDFFERGLSDREGLSPIAPTESSFSIQTDAIGRVVSIERNCAVATPMEPAAGYLTPQTESGVDHISGFGTGSIKVEVLAPYSVKNEHIYRLIFVDDGSLEEIDSLYTGFTNGALLLNVTTGDTLFFIYGDNALETIAEKIVDGFMLSFENDSLRVQSSKWSKGRSNLNPAINADGVLTIAVPRDYEIRIGHFGVDSTILPVVPTNFEVWDVTNSENPYKVKYQLTDNPDEPDSLLGILSDGDLIVLKGAPREIAPGLILYTQGWWSFDFAFPRNLDPSLWIPPVEGDIYTMTTKKHFTRDDAFEFTMIGNEYREDRAKKSMNNIYTVPNPYIAASSLEQRIISQEVGRGERRIDFVNLPQECIISIFTSSGRLVKRIEHSSTIDKGRTSWDLTTVDGLEVAHGIYFYHVDAKGIGEKIGKLAIIK
ncbi:MAG: hypothetical protein IID16_12335 [Candidatus Marinimicrobia bacterium]|nr:hypothetical protein [Candidatus Neomarinimicrobiota bacterium]